VQIGCGDVAALKSALETLQPDTTIILGEGTFTMSFALHIRVAGFHLLGQGMDITTLDFADLAGA
jgi:hypothetical protein